jgi:hypothetical protein
MVCEIFPPAGAFSSLRLPEAVGLRRTLDALWKTPLNKTLVLTHDLPSNPQ